MSGLRHAWPDGSLHCRQFIDQPFDHRQSLAKSGIRGIKTEWCEQLRIDLVPPARSMSKYFS